MTILKTKSRKLVLATVCLSFLGAASLPTQWERNVVDYVIPSAEASGGKIYKNGFVIARGLELGPTGQPIFVEIDRQGQVAGEIGEAINTLKDAVPMARSTYMVIVQSFYQVQQQNPQVAQGAYVLTRDEYQSRDFGEIDVPLMNPVPGGPTTESVPINKPPLQPGTKSVLVRANSTILDPRLLPQDKGPILFEAPIDLRPSALRVYQDDSIRTLLLSKDGQVLFESAHDIGYKTGLWEDPDTAREALGPVSNARVDAGLAYTYRGEVAVTNDEGRYHLPVMIPPCPGFYFEHNPVYWARLYYRNFDPEAPNPTGYLEFNRNDSISCNGMGEVSLGASLSAQMTQIAVQAIVLTTADIYIRPDITIDLLMLTGEARLSNGDGGNLPITTTEYEAAPYPHANPSEPRFLDLNRDRNTDFTVLDGETVNVYLGDQAAAAQAGTTDLNGNLVDENGNPIDPTLTRLADYEPDFEDKGLLTGISAEDLKKTDIYVYRVSTGQTIVKKTGLLGREIIQNDGKFYYRMLIPGPLGNLNYGFGAGRSSAALISWQEAIGMPEEMRGRKANALRPGEQIKLIAVNRPTGYIGTVTATLQNPTAGRLDFPIDQIEMRPPNLRIRASRTYQIDGGHNRDAQARYQVGFEGAALTTDTIVELHTDWFDQDGTPLPIDLEGYTGRLAKVTGPNSLEGGEVATFPIRPGSYTQLVSFSGDILGSEHFYLHVSGFPAWQDPGVGAGTGALQYRPKNYVPVKVGIYDEESTRRLRNLAEYNRVENQPADYVAPVYRWSYRPEMQFSVLELVLREQELNTEYDQEREQTTSTLDVDYTLNSSEFDRLDPFGAPVHYVFDLAGQELEAYTNEDGTVSFDNVETLRQVSADDVLTLSLLNNNDTANVLWQYTGIPLIHTNVSSAPVARTYLIGAYDVGNQGLSDVTDTYKIMSFMVPRLARVKLEVTDPDKQVLGTLIHEVELAPGSYRFLFTYEDIEDMGVLPREDIDFYLKLSANIEDENFTHNVYYHGDLAKRFEGRMLGEIIQHNVLVQDGSLLLQRRDIDLPGLGPDFAFIRNYSNKPTENGLLGVGWSHNLNIALQKVGWGDNQGNNNLPSWVDGFRGRFFQEDPPDDPLSKIAVSNGGTFRKQGGAWIPQRARHGTLTEGPDGFEYRAKDGTLYLFPYSVLNNQPVEYIEDRNGNRMSFAYDHYFDIGTGITPRVSSVTDAIGRTLTLEYESTLRGERLARVIGPDDIQVNFSYDQSTGQLLSAVREDAPEYAESYAYVLDNMDQSYNLTSSTDPNQHVTNYAYYAQGEVSTSLSTFIPGFNPHDIIHTVTYADGARPEFFYDVTTDNVRRVVDARGNTTRYVLNFFGNPLRIEEPLGKVTRMTWSIDEGLPDNVMTSKTDALNRTWRYEYDTKGNVTRETDPYNRATVSTWDQQYSQLLTRTDRNNNTIENQYDEFGNLELEIDAEANETSHTYDSRGLRESTTSARGFTTTYAYDTNGFPASISEPEGTVTEFDYDIRGRMTRKVDGNDNVTTFTYDPLDRLTRRTDPDLVSITYEYDPKGNKTAETTRFGARMAYTYDARDRVTRINRTGTDIAAASKTYDYDLNSNLTDETDWKGQNTHHTYDELNRRETTRNRQGIEMAYGYDLVGNKTSETDYEGRATQFIYDNLDRLERVIDALTFEKAFTYDNEKNLLTEADQEGRVTTYTYDRRYLKASRTNNYDDVYRWFYDESGNLIREVDENTHETTYAYDRQERRTDINRHLDAGTVYNTHYTYDFIGNATAVRDARGNTRTTSYDALNRPLVERDEGNYPTTYAYSSAGKVVSVTDARNNTRITTYDSLERKTRYRAADGGVTRFEYDNNNNLVRLTDPRNTVSATVYDELDRPVEITSAVGLAEAQTIHKEYDNVGNLIAEVDGRGNRTGHEYDDLNRRIHTTNAALDVMDYEYDRVGNVTRMVDYRRNPTVNAYDRLNRLTLVTDALAQTLSYTYDPVGNQLTVTDKRGTTTTHTYDALNRLTRSEKPDGQGNTIVVIRKEYDGNDNVTADIDANDNRAEYTYTPRNQLHITTNADSTTAINTYDEVGNLATMTDEANQVMRFTYDVENRKASETNNANETTSFGYDINGNLASKTNPRGYAWAYTYDGLNRLASVSDPLTHTTLYEYDDTNNLTAQVDAENKRVEYTYDALSRRTGHIQVKSGGNLTRTMEYDENGNLLAYTDPKGQRFNYVFDELNRETQRTFPTGTSPYLETQQIVMAYDPNNNIESITETKVGTSNITDITGFTYDLLDRMLTRTERGRQITYTYDNNGNKTSVSTAAGSTTYSFDNRNRIETAVVDGTSTTTYTYYPDSKKDTVTYPNGTRMRTLYDDADRVSEVINEVVADSSVISRYVYTYDANGNRLTQGETQNGQTEDTNYSYDISDRMTGFTITRADATTLTNTYTYDAVANRLTEVINDNGTVTNDKTFNYDDTHWLTSILDNLSSQTIDYTYDANGNTIQKLDNTQASPVSNLFIYDSRDQLVQVIRGPPGSETDVLGRYDYNYKGLRIRHLGSERGDINYYYDDRSIIEERTSADQLVAHYRYADRLISLQTLTDTQYYHHDALGSTSNLTTSTGTTQTSYRLDPWGHIREQAGTSINRQIFTGQEHDENTDLIYFGARYYDPDTGRFITQDVYLGETTTPPSLHRYLYAYANPTVYIDLYGYKTLRYSDKDEIPDYEEYIQTGDKEYLIVDDNEWTEKGDISYGIYKRKLDEWRKKNPDKDPEYNGTWIGKKWHDLTAGDKEDTSPTVTAENTSGPSSTNCASDDVACQYRRDFRKPVEDAHKKGLEYADKGAGIMCSLLAACRGYEMASGEDAVTGDKLDWQDRAPIPIKKLPLPKKKSKPDGQSKTQGLVNENTKLYKTYIRDIEKQTGRAIPKNQREMLTKELRTQDYSKKMPREEYRVHSSKFTQSTKNKLIDEWEKKTNQKWPRYKQDYYSPKTGKLVVRKNQRYDAHHIIEQDRGGPHAWYNIHPAHRGTEHQGGIHGSGGALKKIDEKIN